MLIYSNLYFLYFRYLSYPLKMRLTLVFIVTTILLGLNACKDPCEETYCENGGRCNDGKCDCPEGFTGDHCELEACDLVNCMNGGVCNNGTCECPEGFSGTNCEVELCPNTPCENGSISYDNGVCGCECLAGYEGADCSTVARDKFIGSYHGHYNCDGETTNNLQISAEGSEVDLVSISCLGSVIYIACPYARIEGNEITIYSQQYSYGGASTGTINGHGTLNGNTLTLYYNISSPDGGESCTITLIK